MKNNNQQGFTLVEVLLSTTIVLFLAGSLYAVFAAGIKLDQRSKQVFVDLDESRLIMEQLSHDLGRAVYYDFRGSYLGRKVFSAQETALIFLIDDGDKMKWVRYMLLVPEKTQVRETRIGSIFKHNETVENVSIVEKELLTLVRDENDFVSFFDRDDQFSRRDILTRRIVKNSWKTSCAITVVSQPKVEWQASWDENFLPAAVRVNFDLRMKSGQTRNFVRNFLLPVGGRNES